MGREPLPLVDCAPGPERFLADVLAGLAGPTKSLPSKYFYDRRGSELFERICELEEYYLPRAEISILAGKGAEIAAALGPRCRLVELGSGNGQKALALLRFLVDPAAYVPVDISREYLLGAARSVQQAYPGLVVTPLCADYTRGLDLPPLSAAARTAVFFPGSTIGNFDRDETRRFLGSLTEVLAEGGALVVGVDLRKEPSRLVAAYDDREGVTAEFNFNLLRRINRELGADFDPGGFLHRAVWNPAEGRMESYLVSQREQRVRLGGREIRLGKDEAILTEYAYKYTVEGFRILAAEAGLEVGRVWRDPERLFSLQYLTVAGAGRRSDPS